MIERIAFYMGRNDEQPNIDLAVLLTGTKDKKGIDEIARGLKDAKQQVANDCIKVLYEIGEREPGLIAEYASDFIQMLKSRNNRLVWGGMTALAKITALNAAAVFENFETVLRAYQNGSVITVDNAISVFAELCKAGKEYENAVFPYIISHLKSCRPREVCQHSERAFICINEGNTKEIYDVLLKRKEDLNDAQLKRLNKLLKKIEAGKYCV